MIKIDNTIKKLQVVLTAAMTTTNMPVVVSWDDKDGGGSFDTATNGTTQVDICTFSTSSTALRTVKYISVYNADTVSKTVQIRLLNNATARIMISATLAVGDTLVYQA